MTAACFDVSAMIDVLADRVADRIVARLGASQRPRFYSASALPPGVSSWRAARESCTRLGIATTKSGKAILIPADQWDRALETRSTKRAPRLGAGASSDDAALLESMGLRARRS